MGCMTRVVFHDTCVLLRVSVNALGNIFLIGGRSAGVQ